MLHLNRHKGCSLRRLLLLSPLWLVLAHCKVYTIDKTEFENRLRPRPNEIKGLSINSLYKRSYKNTLDTIECADASGKIKKRRLHQDSKIVIVTKKNRAIKFYAKTLYIYKDEYLIGERTAPTLRGPNYFPIKLQDIERVEMSGL